MKTIKNTRDVSKSPNTREALKTPEKQRAPLSFRNIPATEESEADYPPKYRDLFSQHQRLKDESSQDSEGSSISVSDQDEEELEDQSSEKNRRKYTQTPETNALDRWKILYAQKEKYDLKREQLRKERKGPEADPECTFKPKLLTSNANIPSVASALPIHERNRLWKEKQQAKLKESSQKEEQRDLSDCTFKPLVNPSKKVKDADRLVNQDCRGVNQFLKRQATARQTKEEKEILLSNPLSRLPEHATKREGKTTIGKYPNLLTSADKHGEGNVSKKGDMFPTVSPKNNTQTPLRNRKNSTQEISFSNENCKAEGPIQDNPIYISEVTYFDAIKKLREELHKIPLNID